MKHPTQWLTASPLWNLASAAGEPRERFRQPALLRFDSDSFMDDLLGLLADDPEQLESYVAHPETWEDPATGWVAAGDDSLSELLKLYQPAQSRYYLVAANLVCQRVGMPFRKVDTAAGDKASMLVRRLVPVVGETLDPNDASTFTEQAWVGDREKGRWQPVADGQVLDGEERLPLFCLPFEHKGRKRRLHAGMLPVAGRELYEGAATSGDIPDLPAAPGDPLAELEDVRKALWSAGPDTTLEVLNRPAAELAELSSAQARDLLSFLLLDLADFLQEHLDVLWQALVAGSPAGLSAEADAVYDRLNTATPWAGAPSTWRQAVLVADAQRAVLNGEEDAAPGAVLPVPNSTTAAMVATAATQLDDSGNFTVDLFTLLDTVASTGADPGVGRAPISGAAGATAAGSEGGIYVVRCVYEQPRCGRLDVPVLSAASRPFRLSSFFDPQAPARPIQIRLPLDTSIAGLRKFPKAVSMLVSNKLRQQVEHLQEASLEDIDTGEISGSESSWGLGMICSLSIPIITIVAFLLLMIFVQLFNIVFWWLAFFKICLPIPVRNDS